MAEPVHALVVDDEPDLCWAIDMMLRPLGVKVSTASRGAEALLEGARRQHRLIFVDAILPDFGGLQLAQMLRQLNPEATIILMSGYYYPEDLPVGSSLASAQIAGFLAKPFRLADVRSLARSALAQQEVCS